MCQNSHHRSTRNSLPSTPCGTPPLGAIARRLSLLSHVWVRCRAERVRGGCACLDCDRDPVTLRFCLRVGLSLQRDAVVCFARGVSASQPRHLTLSKHNPPPRPAGEWPLVYLSIMLRVRAYSTSSVDVAMRLVAACVVCVDFAFISCALFSKTNSHLPRRVRMWLFPTGYFHPLNHVASIHPTSVTCS